MKPKLCQRKINVISTAQMLKASLHISGRRDFFCPIFCFKSRCVRLWSGGGLPPVRSTERERATEQPTRAERGERTNFPINFRRFFVHEKNYPSIKSKSKNVFLYKILPNRSISPVPRTRFPHPPYRAHF